MRMKAAKKLHCGLQKSFSLINEKIKFISIMPDEEDPDDFIKNGKEGLLNYSKKRDNTILYLELLFKKINQNNPYEISKFEKDIKKLSYSIKDETLRKYVLEDFLEKIKQCSYSKFRTKK